MVSRLSGLSAWMLQRLSALIMIASLIVMSTVIVLSPGDGFTGWRALWSNPALILAGMFFMASVLAHSWVGMRDVIIDYVHVPGWRLAALTTLALWLMALALWTGWIAMEALR